MGKLHVDARARFAAGGFFAGAAVVAVLTAVAMSNATALADVAGATVGLPAVRVGASAASPLVSATPNAPAAPSAPSAIVLPAPVPTTETVPAPEPAVLPGVNLVVPARTAPVAPTSGPSKHDKSDKTSAEKSVVQTPAKAGNPSGRQLTEQSGLKRSQSHVPPDGD